MDELDADDWDERGNVKAEDVPNNEKAVEVEFVTTSGPDDPPLPPTVTLLKCAIESGDADSGSGDLLDKVVIGQLFLVGTSHFSADSQEDVRQIIQTWLPDAVMVELCKSRSVLLLMDEETLLKETSNLTFDRIVSMIKQFGVTRGLTHALMLSVSAHITRQIGMAPGGEFRAAHEEAIKIPDCSFELGDRPISITMQRALASLSLLKKLRFFWSILMSHGVKITKEDVEKYKQRDLLEELLKEMAGEFPELSLVFLQERDEYMAWFLRNLMLHLISLRLNSLAELKADPVIVVGVVGIGHVPGIMKNWDRHIDPRKLLTVPKPSLFWRCAKLTAKGAFVAASAYVIYKAGAAVWHYFS